MPAQGTLPVMQPGGIGLCQPPPSPPSKSPSLKRGDRILPPVWLSKQNWEGEDFANLLNLKPSPKPAKMQVNALGRRLGWQAAAHMVKRFWGADEELGNKFPQTSPSEAQGREVGRERRLLGFATLARGP